MNDILQHRARVAERVQFLRVVHAREGRGLIEVRYRPPGGAMSQRFHRADRPELAAELILLLAQAHDVYFGCAPRQRRWGGRRAMARVWSLWADCDGGAASTRLESFEPRPPIVVRSGSAANRHAYWPLAAPLVPRDAVAANARPPNAVGGAPAGAPA